MPAVSPPSDEIHDLRRCVRDLVALSTLPVVWGSAASSGIGRSLAEVLLRVLAVDFVYVRLHARDGAPGHEAARTRHRLESESRTSEIGMTLAPWLRLDGAEPPETIPSPLGEGAVRLAVFPIGHAHDYGLLAVGSERADFPTDTERLLLGVGVNQAAGLLQRKEVEDALRKQSETASFLAGASAAFAELTDYESTLQKVASLAVPFFADWCAVHMQQPDGTVRRLAITHDDPAKVQAARDLEHRYAIRQSDPLGIMRVLRTSEPAWVPSIPESQLVRIAQDEEHLRILRSLGLKSFLCVPLRSRTRTLGAMTFVTAESGRIYGADDLRAARDLADRAAVAVENATLLGALREADRRKDEFLAILAHELRNPLAPIRNALQILRAKGPAEPQLQWSRDVIDRQLQQMTRLVDDLLDVSRITRGKIELRRQRVLLAEVVSSAVEACRPLLEKRSHELVVKVPAEPITLEADQARLAQVLSNLLNNAAKFSDVGGRIAITAERQGDEVAIRVKDTGIGIPPEMLSHIFEMFTQVDRSLERSQGGLGIGLTLAKRLVELHGGEVEAHSDGAGQGSEFVVRLPVATASEGREPALAAGDGERTGAPAGCRILVVDDNRDAVESLAMLLRLLGHQVETALDGLEAVEVASAFGPDVVLLDIGLPKLNGYEAGRRIRDERGEGIVLVALTGWGQEQDRRQSKEAGFDHHMTKPVDFDALKTLLAETIGPRRSAGGAVVAGDGGSEGAPAS
jgi:signal transduction histidine kinase/ActR/RegA family two-component response regulator